MDNLLQLRMDYWISSAIGKALLRPAKMIPIIHLLTVKISKKTSSLFNEQMRFYSIPYLTVRTQESSISTFRHHDIIKSTSTSMNTTRMEKNICKQGTLSICPTRLSHLGINTIGNKGR